MKFYVSGCIPFGEEIEAENEEEAENIFIQDIWAAYGTDVFDICIDTVEEEEEEI